MELKDFVKSTLECISEGVNSTSDNVTVSWSNNNNYAEVDFDLIPFINKGNTEILGSAGPNAETSRIKFSVSLDIRKK